MPVSADSWNSIQRFEQATRFSAGGSRSVGSCIQITETSSIWHRRICDLLCRYMQIPEFPFSDPNTRPMHAVSGIQHRAGALRSLTACSAIPDTTDSLGSIRRIWPVNLHWERFTFCSIRAILLRSPNLYPGMVHRMANSTRVSHIEDKSGKLQERDRTTERG